MWADHQGLRRCPNSGRKIAREVAPRCATVSRAVEIRALVRSGEQGLPVRVRQVDADPVEVCERPQRLERMATVVRADRPGPLYEPLSQNRSG